MFWMPPAARYAAANNPFTSRYKQTIAASAVRQRTRSHEW